MSWSKKRRGLKLLGPGPLTLVIVVLLASSATRMGLLASEPSAQSEHVDTERSAAAASADNSVVAEVLAAVQARQAELDQKELALQKRAAELEEAEALLEQNLAALVAAEQQLQSTLSLASHAADDDMARLVSVYENMKPGDAAQLFEAMPPDFAAGFLSAMRAEAAANIMSGLNPEFAYAISVIIAGRNAEIRHE